MGISGGGLGRVARRRARPHVAGGQRFRQPADTVEERHAPEANRAGTSGGDAVGTGPGHHRRGPEPRRTAPDSSARVELHIPAAVAHQVVSRRGGCTAIMPARQDVAR
jgi:hypothetical protein